MRKHGETLTKTFLTTIQINLHTYLKAFLKVIVLLEEHGVVDDDLGRCDAKVNNAVIHRFS